jgi:hypothetical protein
MHLLVQVEKPENPCGTGLLASTASNASNASIII